MATVQRFEDLNVWKKARYVDGLIYPLTLRGSFSKDIELRNQITRVSGSVMDNIAEGFGRGSRAEFKQFLSYALGSNTEVKSQLYRASDRGHIDPKTFEILYSESDVITRMLINFMKYLQETDYKGVRFLSEELISYNVGFDDPDGVSDNQKR
ncbi:four helix bundle protein [Rudanella paleaurantiibacter]|uniref:Four helix bundle protein n=1 Tax=Rudanella paleaurantiibacter TaxID=2614655 RepID=A0A7J5TZ77_9BACT|nr:four helix bundle protein [Rudanella paleaurantiibacter]KAB7730442.1 four helix bundle protein [Rudanella paleaurantiibacter]